MKKKSINLKKLSLSKDRVTTLNSDQQFLVAGGGPNSVGCPPASANCASQQGNCQTISICNDQCAVTWGCPPPGTQVPQDSICVFCTPNYTMLGQKTC